MNSPPLIVHIIFRLDIGGLENGLVNLINHMPTSLFRHAIVCLQDYSEFRTRLRRPDVALYAMHKKPGKDPGAYIRLWRLLRQLRPDIVHTRNIGTLDCQLPAWLAGVRHRIHGEHGRDAADLEGTRAKYLWLRRLMRLLIHRYIAMSKDLEDWLLEKVWVESARVHQIYNGVDTSQYSPVSKPAQTVPLCNWQRSDTLIIGSVGRMDPVKDQLTLIRAFLRLIERSPEWRKRLRLVHIGDGELRKEALAALETANATDIAWLPGARDDIPGILNSFDIFALPSLGEGISNTILEAMATGLPIVATRVGGNPELVVDGVTGTLVPPADESVFAEALARYVENEPLREQHGQAGRKRTQESFSLAAMVDSYGKVYAELLASR